MKPYLCLLSGLTIALSSGCVGSPSATAQTPVPVMAAPPSAAATPLEQLVAPIALYPDALIALILPAATASSDLVLAARYLSASGDPAAIDQQPWDDSVKGLAHYPDVVKWMDENLAWTQRLGEAYLQKPDDVMAAVQQARLVAQQKGLLADTPQQQIVVEDRAIRIIPAQPDVIYVPRYDPEIIYVDRPLYRYSEPWISFGVGFGVGSWLAYDLDWRSRRIWVDHHRWDRPRHDWRRPHFPGRSDYVSRDHGWHEWRPTPGRPRPPVRHFDRPGGRDFARPAPHPGAPSWRRDHERDGDRRRDGDSHRDGGDRPNRSGERARLPMQPNRIAAPQAHPEPAVSAPQVTNQEQSPRTANPSSVQRRWRTPGDSGQSEGFVDRRSRQDRRPGTITPPAVAPEVGSSAVNSNASPSADRRFNSPGARRGNDQRQAGETRSFRSPARVAAPAVQPAPAVVQPPTVVAPQVSSPATATAPTVRSTRPEARADRGGGGRHENRQGGRGRRDQEP